jgi:hypothetical protein
MSRRPEEVTWADILLGGPVLAGAWIGYTDYPGEWPIYHDADGTVP